jgi:hypothetical protein
MDCLSFEEKNSFIVYLVAQELRVKCLFSVQDALAYLLDHLS